LQYVIAKNTIQKSEKSGYNDNAKQNLLQNPRKGIKIMKKLRTAIIGQGRSGRDIHGKFFRSAANEYVEVVTVVELDPERRARALEEYPGCTVTADYKELFDRKDIDLAVNATYSEMHYSITRDLLSHGLNVLTEKPFGRNYYECSDLIKTAKENGVVLAAFHQSLLAPHHLGVKEVIESGKLGKIEQISIRYNSLGRRWDWQTLQSKLAGSVYNTGPHPIGMALDYLGFDEKAAVVYSKLDTTLTSGDAEDFAKILITAPGKTLVDIEISATDPYTNYSVKVQGSKGTFSCTTKSYKMKYVVDGENPDRPVMFESLKNAEGLPAYCSERLVTHEESGDFSGSSFDTAVEDFYKMLHARIVDGRPMEVTPEMAAQVINLIEKIHADNPLPVKF
jgi:predicted dehydrogenase